MRKPRLGGTNHHRPKPKSGKQGNNSGAGPPLGQSPGSVVCLQSFGFVLLVSVLALSLGFSLWLSRRWFGVNMWDANLLLLAAFAIAGLFSVKRLHLAKRRTAARNAGPIYRSTQEITWALKMKLASLSGLNLAYMFRTFVLRERSATDTFDSAVIGEPN